MSHAATKSPIGLAAAAASLALVLAPGCGTGMTDAQPHLLRLAAQRSADLDSENGMWAFALMGDVLSLSGETMNGMPPNLLDLNGLSLTGVSTAEFTAWFAANPVTADMVMRYLTRCALPASASISYEFGGLLYTWTGALGLAPVWAADYPIPEVEQQLVSACLAAHANKYGAKVPISVLGRRSDDVPIEVDAEELATFPIAEGCFFGNLFLGQGMYSGSDRAAPLTDAESSSRACAMADRTDPTAPSNCPPIVYAGSCSDLCQPSAEGLFYDSCTLNGVVYRPLSTRIKLTALFTCGDGICDFTESCGTGASWDSCSLDCGPCF